MADKPMTITIRSKFTLKQWKDMYKEHFNEKKNPAKKDVASWIASLVDADVEHYIYGESDED